MAFAPFWAGEVVLIGHNPRPTASNGLLSAQRHLDGAVVLSISGEVDLANELSLRACLKTATEAGKHLVVVDLKDLRYIDLSGINALLDASRSVAHNGCSIVLAAVPPTAQRILQIVGLDQVIQTFSTVETAVANGSHDGQTRPRPGQHPSPTSTSP